MSFDADKKPLVFALGKMTAARAQDREADIAAVTGLTEATVHRKLSEAHGKTLVRNVFDDHWPDDEIDVDELGDMTGTAARAENREGDIVEVTGLTEATVRRRLDEAHGKTLVRNVFGDHWPDDEEIDVDELGDMTGTAACAENREGDIAEVTGLTEATVRRRLDEAHGKTLVRNVFGDHWPDDEEIDVDELGDMTGSAACDENREGDIAEVTGLTEATVRRRLDEAHGKTLVRNVFDDYWPDDEIDVDELGDMTGTAACDENREGDIAEVTGLTEATVRRRLDEAHGKTLVRNVFDDHWPDDEIDVDELGDMTGASAQAQNREGEIAEVTGLAEATLHRGPDGTHGKTMVRNVSTESGPAAPHLAAALPNAAPPQVVATRAESTRSSPKTASVAALRLPQPLVDAYRTDKLAVFVGSGLSLGADVRGSFPTWRELPDRLLDACERHDTLSDVAIEAKRAGFKVPMRLEQMLAELGALKTALGHSYQTALNAIFRPANAEAGSAHKAVVALGVRAILTTNYDQLLEQIAERPARQAYPWKEASHALGDLKAGRKVLLKVHGTAERHETVVMSEIEYREARSDPSYQAVLRYLLEDYVFLFVGYGMNDPLDLDLAFRANVDAFKSAANRHYVFLRNATDADSDRYDRDYRARVIPYAEHDEVCQFLVRLAQTRT